MRSLLPLVAIGLLLFTSCASLKEQWVSQSCSREAAYAQGMNDARDGKPMSSGYASLCPATAQNEVRAGYREGYTNGTLAGKESAPLIEVNIGGGSHDPRAWYCELEAFTDKYRAYGPTQLEAKQSVIHQCTRKWHEMHCSDVACRANQ